MSLHDTYTSMLNGDIVDKSAVTKVYIFHCDLYRDLGKAGPQFEASASIAKTIRDDCLSYMKRHQRVL